jgi:hypothetical protein
MLAPAPVTGKPKAPCHDDLAARVHRRAWTGPGDCVLHPGAGAHLARRFGDTDAELSGGSCPLDLLQKPTGSAPYPDATSARSYGRHWTPVHLDVVVTDLDEAVKRAVNAGARLDRDLQEAPWGRMANLSDPFGHGLCLLEMRGKGYDTLS